MDLYCTKLVKERNAPGSKARFFKGPFNADSDPRVPELPTDRNCPHDDPTDWIYVPGPTPGVVDINVAPSGPLTQLEILWEAVTDLKLRFEKNAAFPPTLPRARKGHNMAVSEFNRPCGHRDEARTIFLVCTLVMFTHSGS